MIPCCVPSCQPGSFYQHEAAVSVLSADLGAESAAQLSVLLDYQLIRAVKSPLLNNQHGAFWQLGTSGRGREAVQSLAEVN